MTVSFVNEPIQLFSARHFLLKFLNFHYLILWLIRRCGIIIIILLLAQSRIVMNIYEHTPFPFTILGVVFECYAHRQAPKAQLL